MRQLGNPAVNRIQNSEFTIRNSRPCLPTWNLEPGTRNFRRRRAFTLTELLIVIAIISIMAGLALSAVSGAMELAREQRTRAIINKLDQLVMERYEEYRTRAVPIRIPRDVMSDPLQGAKVAATMRLNALRDLMRMEMPERKADVADGPCDYDPRSGTSFISKMASPSLRNNYIRQVNRSCGSLANWSLTSQGAECLYMIVSTMQDGDKSALDFFTQSEIGDVDGDGMKEILDGWGRPIEYLRWPAGYVLEQPGLDTKWGVASTDDDSQNGTDDFGEWLAQNSDDFRLTTTSQTLVAEIAPDPFDPLKVSGMFALRPLIMSSGRDKEFDLVTDSAGFSYSPASAAGNNAPNPYTYISVSIFGSPVSLRIGTPIDADSDGVLAFADNITNHYQETP